MLDHKRILVFGGDSEIAVSICEQILAHQAAEVMFISPIKSKLPMHPRLEQIEYDFNSNSNHGALLEKMIGHSWDGWVFAGGIGGVRPLKLNNQEFVLEMFQANVFSFIEWSRLLLSKRCFNVGSSIVALSSVSSIKGLKSKTIYSASKAALDAAVRGMAAELADKKIRVNSIQKGWVSSDMNLDFIQSNMALNRENDLDKQLLGPIEPIEVANLTVFLLSDLVKSITGTAILLDGGYTL
jgi:NAD(P)-dependent dehydrogenase (short-subunit alcohol dehydrogenase family)